MDLRERSSGFKKREKSLNFIFKLWTICELNVIKRHALISTSFVFIHIYSIVTLDGGFLTSKRVEVNFNITFKTVEKD